MLGILTRNFIEIDRQFYFIIWSICETSLRNMLKPQ